MINHPPHIENARRALAHFDAAATGAEAGARGVTAANELRILLYEPADEHQGRFVPCACVGCTPREVTA
jgi:hypothetical protein